MPLFTRPLAAAAAAAAVVVGTGGAVVAFQAVSSDSAQLSASCDPNPAVSDSADGGSQFSVTCTVPRTTVTATETATATATATETVTESPKPSATPTPSVTPTTATPSTSATPTPTATAAASGGVLGASLGQNLPAPTTLGAVRYYRAPAWKGSELEAAYNKGTRVFVVSTKDSTPASMVAMIQAAPKDARFYVTTYHEPDDNIAGGSLTVATYCNRMNAMGQAVAGFPNVKFGPIHNGWLGAATWKADEQGCDKSLWGFFGEDRYSPKYETAANQYDEGRDYAKSLGLPMVLGEIGADPSNAAGQKAVAASARAYALDPTNDVAVTCWWQQTGYTFASSDVERAFLG